DRGIPDLLDLFHSSGGQEAAARWVPDREGTSDGDDPQELAAGGGDAGRAGRGQRRRAGTRADFWPGRLWRRGHAAWHTGRPDRTETDGRAEASGHRPAPEAAGRDRRPRAEAAKRHAGGPEQVASGVAGGTGEEV